MKKIGTLYSKNFYYLLVLIPLLYTCSSQKRKQYRNENNLNAELFQPVYNISASTRRFIYELEKELKESEKDIIEYTPSERMLEEFSIRAEAGNYFISGFIKTKDNFDIKSFENTGTTFGMQSGNINTVNVPLYYLSTFLISDEIEYFEIAQKVYPR